MYTMIENALSFIILGRFGLLVKMRHFTEFYLFTIKIGSQLLAYN